MACGLKILMVMYFMDCNAGVAVLFQLVIVILKVVESNYKTNTDINSYVWEQIIIIVTCLH